MLSGDIWIFAEKNGGDIAPVTLEMMCESSKFTEQIEGDACACLFGHWDEEHIQTLSVYGAQKMYVIADNTLSAYSLDLYTSALKRLLQRHRPMAVMFGATVYGSELAPRLAARLKLPIITEVKRLEKTGKDLAISKSCFEDKVFKKYVFKPERTVILTVLPGDMEAKEAKADVDSQVIQEMMDDEKVISNTHSLEIIKGDPNKISIEEADLIISAGKGIGKNIGQIKELAEILEASVAGSRPLVDEGVMPFERQIGLTGKSVKPRFIMNCGISGAREYLAGVENPRLSIAINTDEKALIFKTADLGIHGNVHEIIPALIKELKERYGRESIEE